MYIIKALFVLLLSLFTCSTFAQVQYVGPDENYTLFEANTIKSRNFVDSSNVPHIAYIDARDNRNVMTIKKYVSGIWLDITTDSLIAQSFGVINFEIEVSPQGVINLLVVKQQMSDEFHLFTLQNNQWNKFNEVYYPPSTVYYVRMVFNNAETPIVAYVSSLMADYSVDFCSINNNQWVYYSDAEVPDISAEKYFDLAIHGDEIVLVWYDWIGNLKIKHANALVWQDATHDITNNISNVKVFVASDKIHIAAWQQEQVLFLTNESQDDYFQTYKNKVCEGKVYDVKMNGNGDYCIMYREENLFVFSSENTSYTWNKKKIAASSCFIFSTVRLEMTNDFSPFVVLYNKVYILNDQLIDLNTDEISTAPGSRIEIKRNQHSELFLVLVTDMYCAGLKATSIEVYKWDGSVWNLFGDIIDSVLRGSELFVEINPLTQLPIIGFNNIDDQVKIYEYKNGKWKDSNYLLPELNIHKLVSMKINPFEELMVLLDNGKCYKLLNNGLGVDMGSTDIQNKMDLITTSRFYMDALNNLYIVGNEKQTGKYKILKYINSFWQELPVIPVENSSFGNYDLTFDEFNRINIVFRYKNGGVKTGIYRYNSTTNSWEDPYGGFQSNSVLNTLNLFFINGKPYLAYLTSTTSPNNIKILTYTNEWVNATKLPINKYTSTGLDVIKENNNLFFAFNGESNVVARLDVNALGVQNNRQEDAENFIFPNPAQHTIQLNLNTDEHVSRLRFYNTLGQVVHEHSTVFDGEDINISMLEDGLYIVECILSSGNRYSQKLAVRK